MSEQGETLTEALANLNDDNIQKQQSQNIKDNQLMRFKKVLRLLI